MKLLKLKGQIMIEQSIFDDIKKVNGYLGAVLSDYTGEVLVSDTNSIKKLDETSMRFNEDFRNLHDVTSKLSLGILHDMQLSMDKADIVMTCSGADQRVHLHAFVILEKGASTSLAKMALTEVVNDAAASLTK